jgi:predicted O-methyltransferase YrrM
MTRAMSRIDGLLFRRPTILNALHWLGLKSPTSQTAPSELEALEEQARGRRAALEIGSYQGVSAAYIARGLAEGGKLYCIDPWPDTPRGSTNPMFSMFTRHLRRLGLSDRIVILRGFSSEMAGRIPEGLDFIFVDGDHSRAGIEGDWKIVKAKLREGGIVCLHDTVIPTDEPWRTLDSVRFFEEVIANDRGFRLVKQVHSMSVLEKLAADS